MVATASRSRLIIEEKTVGNGRKRINGPRRKPFAKKKTPQKKSSPKVRNTPRRRSRGVRSTPASRVPRTRPTVSKAQRRNETRLKDIVIGEVEPSPIFSPERQFYVNVSMEKLNDFLTFVVADFLMKTDSEGYLDRGAGNSICHAGFKWYLMQFVLDHLLNVGAIRSAGASLAYQQNPPSPTAAIPVSLAKFLEQFGPYQDPTCNTQCQALLLLDGTAITASACSLINTANEYDMAKRPSNFHMGFEPRGGVAGTEVIWQADTAAGLTYDDISANANFDNIIRSSGVQFVEYKNLKKTAPDASFCANFVQYSTGGVYCTCPVPEFDPEVCALVHGLGSSSEVGAYVKPSPTFVLAADSVFATEFERYMLGGVAVLNQCRYAPGKIRKTLKNHPASGFGKRALKSLYPILRRVDFTNIADLCHVTAAQLLNDRIESNDLDTTLFPKEDNDKLNDLYYSLMWYFISPIITRILSSSGVTHFLLNAQGAEFLAYVGKVWEAIPLPVTILDVISQIGPVIFDGKLVLPVGDFGPVTSNLLDSVTEFVEMSHSKTYGSTALADRRYLANFPTTPATVVTREFFVFNTQITRAGAGYDSITTFCTFIPRRYSALFKRALSKYRFTDQFLSEKLPLMGGNTMLMTLVSAVENGDIDQDIEHYTGSVRAYLLNVKSYRTYSQILAAMPLSREDVGRAAIYCPFHYNNSISDYPYLSGATQIFTHFDPWDPMSQMVEEVISDSESTFSRILAADVSKNDNNTLYAYRGAMSAIFANLFPESLFVTDTPQDNWMKLKCNLHIGAAPYNGLPYFDPTKYGSPPLYEHIKKFLKGGSGKIKAGYRKLKKFVGTDVPGEINDFTNAWVQLGSEVGKAAGPLGAISAAMA